MSTSRVNFTMNFYDDSGRPMRVTFRTYPDLKMTTDTAAVGFLAPGSSFNFSLFDATPNLQTGWASLVYDSSSARLGGYAAFRYKSAGVINEALVPLSAYNDTLFMMPFDNFEGFATGIALTNPASNLSNQVTILAMDLAGSTISTETVTIPPNGHMSFVLSDRMRQLAGRLGTLLVSSNLNRLSAVGIIIE
jgi:hypothetical protein